MIILVIGFGQVLILLKIGLAVSAQKYRHLKLNSYRLVAKLFSKTRFYFESYLHRSQAKNSRSKKIVLSHDFHVREIIRYAQLKNVSQEDQKWIIESTLEYLAVMRVLPEENITQWPESGLVGGVHADLKARKGSKTSA